MKKAIICINIAILIVTLSIGALYIHAEGLKSRFDENLIIGQSRDSIIDRYGTYYPYDETYYPYEQNPHYRIKELEPSVISYFLCKEHAISLLDYFLIGDNYSHHRKDLYFQIRFDEDGIAYDTCIVQSDPLYPKQEDDYRLWQYGVIDRLWMYIAFLVGVEAIIITVKIIRSKKAKKPAETSTAETN